MLRIMLVEDEPPILRELDTAISAFGEDFSVVATAANGDAALNKLRAMKGGMDLLITDLHIPGVDGLTLIETARREYPELTCAILTGYSEFAYAKKAIALQVADYLLKPVNEDALRALLERCLLKKCFGSVATHGKPLPGKNGGGICAAVFCIGAYPYYSTLENILPPELWDYFPLGKVVEENRVFSGALIGDGFASTVKNVIFSLQPGKTPADAGILFASLQNGPVPLSIAISGSGGMEGTRQAIQAACRALHQNMVFGRSNLFFCDFEASAPQNAAKKAPARAGEPEALAALFAEGKRAAFQSECARLLQNMRQNDITQQQATHALSQLYDACAAHLAGGPVSETESGEIINETFMLSDNYGNLSENIISIFSDLHHQAIAGAADLQGREDILAQVDAYIQSHYRQQLSAAQLAKEFGVTPAYLSKIFRAYRHMSPLEYTVQLRIEKAKRLLLDNPPLSVREVAGAVGYEDSLYFSKVFKKMVGVSPRQYAETGGRALQPSINTDQ